MNEDYLPAPGDGLRLIPEQASSQAAQVDTLYWALLGVSAVLVLVLVLLVVYFGVRYRAGSKAARSGYFSAQTSRRLELVWALGLLLVFLGLFGWAGALYLDMYRTPEAGMTINVVGKQWMWKAQHPDGTREINTLHVPVGETVRLRITSQDVIHSFSVPAFRLKRDAVPDMYSYAWFEATKPGEYALYCAEYCGTDHSRMRGKVVVMEREDYQDWLARNGTDATPEAAGKRLFQSYGCTGCHAGESSVRAPDLAGVFGRPVPLADGTTIVADEAYLRDSILRPQKHVVAGYDPVMPSFEGQISEDEILQIIAYLKSLGRGDQEQAAGEPASGGTR